MAMFIGLIKLLGLPNSNIRTPQRATRNPQLSALRIPHSSLFFLFFLSANISKSIFTDQIHDIRR